MFVVIFARRNSIADQENDDYTFFLLAFDQPPFVSSATEQKVVEKDLTASGAVVWMAGVGARREMRRGAER